MSAQPVRDAWRDRRREDRLTFTLDRRRYPVARHPAQEWVLAVLDAADEPAELLLAVLDEEAAGELWEDALDPDSPVTTDLLVEIGRALLAREAGRPWWQVTQLIGTLVDGWASFDAVAADAGLTDPLEWPLERLCNWIYHRLTRDADESRRAEIDASLAAPAGIAAGIAAGVAGGSPGAGMSEEEMAAAWAADGGWEAMASQFGVADEHGVGRAAGD